MATSKLKFFNLFVKINLLTKVTFISFLLFALFLNVSKVNGQTYGSPCFTETFGVVPSSYVGLPYEYRGEISGRGEMGMAFWFWPATCTGTGFISVNYDSAMSCIEDTTLLPPRESGVSNWYFVRVTELLTGTPYNVPYLNDPSNTWCLFQRRNNISSPWNWVFTGPNTTCPDTSNLVRYVHQVRWYYRGGTWMLGNYQRKVFKVEVPCSQYSICMADGGYCLSPNPRYVHRPDSAWLRGADHTPGDVNGLMLVVNAAWEKGQFYKRSISGLCYNSQFEFKAYYANILVRDWCNPDLPINLRFEIWDRNPGDDESNSTVPVGGTASNGAVLLNANNTGDIEASSTLTWNSNSLIFNVPANQDEVFLVLRNNAIGGCGNDLAIDDISFSPYIPFTLNYNLELNNYCVTNQIILNPGVVSGSIPSGYVFQWQQADEGLDNWTNLGTPVNDILNAAITLNISALSNKKFRIVSSSDVLNFNNPNCFVASGVFHGNTVQLPTANVSGPDDVCGTSDHQPRSVDLTINYQGNYYPWTYYYSINGGPEVSVTVPTGNTDIVTVNNITDVTTFVLLRVKTDDCMDPVIINQTHTILYSIGIPGSAVSITGPNPACIGSISDFSIPPVAGAVYYNWVLSGGWSIISGQGTTNAQLLISSTPIHVVIETINACGHNIWQSEEFSTTNEAPPMPSDIYAPDADCLNPAKPGSTDILFEAAIVLGADAYYWEWDAPVTLGTQRSGTGQYLQKIVLSVPNNIASFSVRVRVQNECGFSTVKEVIFTPQP